MGTSPIHTNGGNTGAVVGYLLAFVILFVIHFFIIKRIARPLFTEKGYYFEDAKKNANWIAVISVLLFAVLGLVWSWVITLIIMFIVHLTLHEVNNDDVDYDKNEYDYRDDYKDKSSPADELRKWKQLLDDGIISEEDFNRKKEDLLRK